MKNKKFRIGLAVVLPLVVVLSFVLASGIYLYSAGKSQPLNPMRGANDKRSQVLLEGEGYNIDLKQKQEIKKDQKKRVRQEQEKRDQDRQERRKREEPKQGQPKQPQVKKPEEKKPQPEQGQTRPDQKPDKADKPSQGQDDSTGNQKEPGPDNQPDENKKPIPKPPDQDQDLKPGNDDTEVINPDEAGIVDVSDNDNKGPAPEDPEKKPTIKTNLESGKTYVGKKARFWVEAKDYEGYTINLTAGKGNVSVWVNSEKIYSEGGGNTSRITYNWPLKNGANQIKIRAEDRRRNYIEKIYTVNADTSQQESAGKVTVSLEAKVLGIGVIAAGRVDIYKDDNGAQVIERFFKEKGIKSEYTGSPGNSYYLRRIHKQGIVANVDFDAIEQKIVDRGWPGGGLYDPDSLGEKDFGRRAGWVYSVGGEFKDYGFSSLVPQNGQTIRITFSVYDSQGYKW